MRPYLEKTLHKNRAGRVAQDVGPEFKPQYREKKNQRSLAFFRLSLIEVERV
jgi:hypothetical protein